MDPTDGARETRTIGTDGGSRRVASEGRAVVEEQLRTLRNTDEKALATARVNGVVLGLLLSAASLSEVPVRSANRWLVGGGSLLLGSLAVAVLTYSVDRPSYGGGPGFIDAVSDGQIDGNDVDRALLGRYAEWIEANGEEIASNGTYLLVAQGLLVLGLSSIGVGLSLVV